MPLEDVALFKAILQQQRFSDFDRMSYGNEGTLNSQVTAALLTERLIPP